MRAPSSTWSRRSAPRRPGAVALPAALFGAAFICALAAVTALPSASLIALAKFDRPARRRACRHADLRRRSPGGLGWYGAERLRRDL